MKKTIVTAKELKAFRKIAVCNEACEKIIEKVVHHFEMNTLAKEEWWRMAIKKYNLADGFAHSINSTTGELIKGRSGLNEKLANLERDVEVRHYIKDQIKEAFEEVK